MAVCVAALAVASAPPGVPPGLANHSWPLAYMQSSFVTGHRNGVPCRTHGNIDVTLTDEQRLAALRVYASDATSFKGGEMFINTMETPEALADVRRMNELILQVANETGTPPFWGFWIPSRLPGMWWPANYTKQPDSFRARGLASDGSEWLNYPTEPDPGTSILNFQGTDLDITNPEAVATAIGNLARVMRAECTPASACVGPLVGSYLFSEAALTPPYQPFATHPYRDEDNLQFGNRSDLQPPLPDGRPPLLRMGNATELYTDDRVVFSFYQGPKRIAPLFSTSARDSFAAFCASRGRTNVTALPADRSEFNDDDATVSLPPHVAFAPASDAELWGLWEDWVMSTWLDYCARVVGVVDDAQRGNTYFGGAFSFQLAGWYSIRARACKPVTYGWRDFNGTLQRTVGEVVADWPHYDDLNPVTKGQDLEMWAAEPWFSGWIHEASHGVPDIGVHPPMVTPRETRDRFIMASDRHRHFVNAQGAMAREIVEGAGKIFGVFSRAAFISDPTFKGPSVADTLTEAGFEQMWSFSTSLLRPSIVSSLNDARFVPLAPGQRPPLHDVFERLFRSLPPPPNC